MYGIMVWIISWNDMELYRKQGETPVMGMVHIVVGTVCKIESYCLRVQYKGGWYISPKAKYRWETDSEQVLWRKVEKNSEKRVQRICSC